MLKNRINIAILCAFLIVIWPVMAFPATTWQSGKAYHIKFLGILTGDQPLDSFSGASINPNCTATVYECDSGVTYVYEYSSWLSGDTSLHSPPHVVVPEDLRSGGDCPSCGTGTTAWRLDPQVHVFSGVTSEGGVSTVSLWVGRTPVRWDNGSGKIDGEQIANNTIDDDSIDLTDVTLADLTDDVGYSTNAELTAHTNAGGFTGVTDFAVNSQVTGELTNRTNPSAFAGVSDFATHSQVTGEFTNRTNAGSFTGVSDFVLHTEMTPNGTESGTSGQVALYGNGGTSVYAHANITKSGATIYFITESGTTVAWVQGSQFHISTAYLYGTLDMQTNTIDNAGTINVTDLTGTGNVDLSGASASVNTPTDNSHIATKKYVDDNEDDVPEAGDFGAATHLDANGAIDWDVNSGVSIGSAVTKFKSFTVNDPQDIGGGSGNSPFRLFSVPTIIYPNGVFIVGYEIEAQHGSAQTLNVNFSEWSSGSSENYIAEISVVTNTGPNEKVLVSGTTSVIEAGKEIFCHLENTSGVSLLSGTVIFMPR